MSNHPDKTPLHWDALFEADDDTPSNPKLENTIGDVMARRWHRRDVMAGALGVTAIAAMLPAMPRAAQAEPKSRFDFVELASGIDETHHVADGYEAEILVRWGDPIFPNAPAFDPHNQSAYAQLKQFGYNNDYLGFIRLSDDRALLCANHEYTSVPMMFPPDTPVSRKRVDIEMAAHGGSVVEIRRNSAGQWHVDTNSRFNRRITPLNTAMTLDGPAAGTPRLQTKADPSGRRVIGTLNNCAGGMTPWGTWLMAEENFHGYFLADPDAMSSPQLSKTELASMKRYGVPSGRYQWGDYYDRFNVDREPHESNRFGWIVEVDPFNPHSTPVKHTALGRFSHEGCETVLAPDGRIVVYSGDDRRFEYVYKFISSGKLSSDALANRQLLSSGTLYVARFDDDGSLTWMPLVHGHGGLTAANGFRSQADILIDTRLAADILGATPMDRPEDVQPGPGGAAYVMLTNNNKRGSDQINAANPRDNNVFGHIIEILENGQDPTALRAQWDFLIKGGDPAQGNVGALWHPATSSSGWFGSPDNAAIDALGRLWITTDQGSKWNKTGKADGFYSLETTGPLRGHSKLFFRGPVGAELCGPCFTPNMRTAFVAVQHPGADGGEHYKGFGRKSRFNDPVTGWPDFRKNWPPRPSVVAINRKDGGIIAV